MRWQSFTREERQDVKIISIMLIAAVLTFVAVFVLPSGLDDGWIDPSQPPSQSLLQRMASYF